MAPGLALAGTAASRRVALAAAWALCVLHAAAGDSAASRQEPGPLLRKCLHYTAIQSEHVKTGFDVRNMAGTFYELAMHDYTQSVCVAGPTCVRSQKVIDGLTIRDNFTIACFGSAYSSALEFRIVPEKPGYLEGRWSAVTGDRVIPDTVVEFKESLEPESDAQYEWVIEVQCAEELGEEIFVGVNFYAKHATAENLAEMTAAAERNGIGPMMYSGLGLRPVHQGADCWYNANLSRAGSVTETDEILV